MFPLIKLHFEIFFTHFRVRKVNKRGTGMFQCLGVNKCGKELFLFRKRAGHRETSSTNRFHAGGNFILEHAQNGTCDITRWRNSNKEFKSYFTQKPGKMKQCSQEIDAQNVNSPTILQREINWDEVEILSYYQLKY